MPHDPAEPPELNSISALLPAFDIEGLIARGATGAVYKARQRSLDRDVAIRIVPREKGDDPAFRSSFMAMAKAMASLSHPGLIRVYDSGEVDGLPYLVAEYVPGKSLRHSAHGKAIDPRQAVQIVIAVCQGLAHAHGKGIVHGAIRPANILLTPKCEPKIGNFDFGHQQPSDGPSPEVSAYNAPELAAGTGSINPQADVYSIGVMLQELLTGIPAGTIDAARTAAPDLKLAAICQKAVHPDPALRYADAGTLAEALGQWRATGTPLLAPIPRQTSPYRPKAPVVSYPSSRAGRGLLTHCAVIALLLVAIQGVWGAYQEKQENLALLRKTEAAKHRVIIVNAQPGKETPHGIDTLIVQLKP